MATTTRARANTSPKPPMAMMMAHSTGIGCIKKISDDANTFAALLSVIGVFPQAEQQRTLIICADIARTVCSELDALVGGAS